MNWMNSAAANLCRFDGNLSRQVVWQTNPIRQSACVQNIPILPQKNANHFFRPAPLFLLCESVNVHPKTLLKLSLPISNQAEWQRSHVLFDVKVNDFLFFIAWKIGYCTIGPRLFDRRCIKNWYELRFCWTQWSRKEQLYWKITIENTSLAQVYRAIRR